jgi:hypothetical protein
MANWYQLAIVGAATIADGDNFALHRTFFAGGVWDKQPALGLFLALGRLYYDAVGQRSDAEVCSHSDASPHLR